MFNQRKSPIKGIGAAILFVAIALGLRILGMPVLQDESPFLLFFSALALASWYGGFIPGTLATVLGSISVAFLFLSPVNRTGEIGYIHILHHFVFLCTGTLISWLMERLHAAVERSNRAEVVLEERIRERTFELAEANRMLQAEKNNLLGILDAMQEAVYIVNPQFEIEYINPAMERDFGKKVESQKCYQYLCNQDDGICPWCRNAEVFDGKSFSCEYVSPKNNKTYDSFETSIQYPDGIPRKLKILHNITPLKKTEEELSQKNRQLQKLGEELSRMSSELLTAQENERLRIARELHDDLGQSLTLIKLKIGLIDINMTEAHQRVKSLCDDASNHVDQAIEGMRRLSRDLCPATIETLGTTIALRKLVEDFNKTGGVRIDADIENVDELPLQSGILLYRIFQEGLNNIIKHSGATSANISLKKNNGKISIEIKDNGKGLEIDAIETESRKTEPLATLGLTIMRARIRTLGGVLEIQSKANEGTRLFFAIPA
jgi:signal transduction histidine kinase